jgi:uncharacterized membrane protein YkoI
MPALISVSSIAPTLPRFNRPTKGQAAMKHRALKIVVALAALAGLAAGGAAIAGATGGDEGDPTPPAAEAAHATRAALAHTGGSEANSVELDGEDGATYEVEVTRPDGSTVDVRLDKAYDIVKVERDSEG